METLNRPSFNKIGEMTCITHAWLSPGETLKYVKYHGILLLLSCILTHATGSSKYGDV